MHVLILPFFFFSLKVLSVYLYFFEFMNVISFSFVTVDSESQADL